MTGLCTRCGERPIHAKGMCDRCRQRGPRKRCEICGALCRSSRLRCVNHPPECARKGCAEPVSTPTATYCKAHGVPRSPSTSKTCTGPGPDGTVCGRPVHGRGLCNGHHMQSRRGIPLFPLGHKKPSACSFVAPDGTPCERKYYAKGHCQAHYRQNAEGRVLRPVGLKVDAPERYCEVVLPDGTVCDKPHRARGMCTGHYKRAWNGMTIPVNLGRKKAEPKTLKARARAQRSRQNAAAKALPPLPPWNPNELKHVDNRPPKTGPSGEDRLATLSAPDPLPATLVQALQDRYMATGRADLLAVLGIVPGREQIPLEAACS